MNVVPSGRMPQELLGDQPANTTETPFTATFGIKRGHEEEAATGHVLWGNEHGGNKRSRVPGKYLLYV